MNRKPKMPPITALLTDLQTAGLRLEVVEGHLKVTPRSEITPELDTAIRESTAELLHHLAHVAPGGERVCVTGVSLEEPGMAGCVVWEVAGGDDRG